MACRSQVAQHDSFDNADRSHKFSIDLLSSGNRIYPSTEAYGKSRVHQGDILHGNTIHNHFHLTPSYENPPAETSTNNTRSDSRSATRNDEHARPKTPARDKIEKEASKTQVKGELRKQEKSRAELYEILSDSLRFTRMSARLLNVGQAAFKTCQWIFQHDTYRMWMDDSQLSHHHGFMWIKGKPGSGKSTIMKLLHDSTVLNYRGNIALAYFFNRRASGDLEKSSLGLLRSLVSQILKSLPSVKEQFLTRFEPKVLKSVVEEWTVTELKEFLSDALCVNERPPANIFIDALDEGHVDDVRQLVAYLEQLTIRAIANGTFLRVCLSSRHYPHITIRKGLPLMLDEEDDHDQDIRTFVYTTLNLQAETLLDEICVRAAGVFLWAVLVVPRLNAKMDEGADLDAAKALLQKLPTDLDALFTGILDRDAGDIDHCVELLQWASFLQTALSPEDLYEALQVASGYSAPPERPDKERLRRLFPHRSRGLLEITRDQHPVVQFIHETVRIFLLTPHGLPRIRPVLAENIAGSSHEMLKRFCLKFIILKQCYYEKLLPPVNDEGVYYKAVDGSDGSNTYDDKSIAGAFPPKVEFVSTKLHSSRNTSRQMDLYRYAVCHIFRHAELAELHGISQQGSLKVLEDKKLLTILCHCSLLYRSITTRLSSQLFATIRARERSSRTAAKSEDDLVQLVKCMVSTENELYLFRSAITIACTIQNADIVRLIVVGGVKGNSRLVAEVKKYPYSQAGMVRLLHETIHLVGIKEVEVLLALGVRIDSIDPDSRGLGTALQAAVYWRKRDIFDLLVKSGADVNQQAGVFGTALHIAAYQGQVDIVTKLLDHNACVNVQAGVYGTALQAATYGCHKQVVEVLCKAGADVNVAAGKYETALQAAAYTGHQGLIEFLLQAGADVNFQGGTYGTALQAAAWSLKAAVASTELLLTQGASIDARAGMYGSALHAASIWASFEIIDIESDEIVIREHDRGSCHAGEACKVAIVETLLRRGAITTADDWQEAGLIQVYHELFSLAIENDDNHLINTLLNAATENNSTNGKATHGLWGAALFGNLRLTNMLLQYGAKPPSEGIHLRSEDCAQWVWDEFREQRQYLVSCFDWLTINDDGHCRGD